MTTTWLNRWNQRYMEEGFAYGTAPNEFLKERLSLLPAGKILFAAEGEGRNAIYAAKQGWDVAAFDISEQGRGKAIQWAGSNGVEIDYQVGELPQLDYRPGQFNAIALIYAHFPPDLKSRYHRMLDICLQRGGTVVFEAFGKGHLDYRNTNPKVGGPKDLDSLFSTEEIWADFKDYEIFVLEEKEMVLNEGKYHKGTGSVVRFVGRKK